MGTSIVTPASGIDGVGSYTWATKPNAAGFKYGALIVITDIGVHGSLWWTDTAKWLPMGALELMEGGLYSGIPSSGSIGNNGALSGITALPISGMKLFLYFPANAIFAGSAAGLYYVEMSSTTAGTIYNNTYTSGTPKTPASKTAFVTTGPGAYTQTTGAEIGLLSIPIPGGAMGKNGVLRAIPNFLYPNNANQKSVKAKLGATAFFSINMTTTTGMTRLLLIQNVDDQAIQVANLATTSSQGVGTMTGSPVSGAENTAADISYTQTGQLANASDFILTSCSGLVLASCPD